MRYGTLGSSGLVVSVLGLGGNNFGRRTGDAAARAVVDAALEAGVTLIDTADTYGEDGASEAYLGDALRGRRDDVLIATKFGGWRGEERPEGAARGSRRYIRLAVEGSLRRLQTDWIDLYQYHVPDGTTPIDETLATLDELVAEGKVRYVGSSNFTGWRLTEAEWVARERGFERFISVQNSYNLLEREGEGEVVPACERYGIGILPFFPLASGLLTGKLRRGDRAPEGSRLAGREDSFSDETFDRVEALERFAEQRGRTLLDVAIGGLAAQSMVGSVIAGATGPEQVRANAAASDWTPSDDDLLALDEIVPRGRPTSGR